MRQLTIITLSAAALALAACGQKADNSSTETTTTTSDNSATTNVAEASNGAPVASSGQPFVNTAAASDAFEIATSQLAATDAQSSAVKSFAKKMIEAHTGSTAKLKGIAAGLTPALTPDPTLTSDQQKTLDDLKTKKGADFDKAYAKAQVDGHQATLDALKSYSSSGDIAQLKSFATDMVPTVTAHLNMAKGLKA